MIKNEVTGNSLPEVADKLLAIGASLRASAAVETPRGATKEEASVGNAPQKANAAVVTEPAPTLKSSVASTDTPAPAASASEDEELEVVDLPPAEPEVNLRDLVLSVVEKRGKPVMEEILSRFGAAKASLVSPELLPELIALCHEALAK